MFRKITLLGLLATVVTVPAFADGASKEESAGVGAGAVIGGVVGGPLGAIVGAAFGAKLGDEFHQKNDVHVHVPEGATPKDGPSAGVGMCTALVSALTGIAVKSDVAMTGEITLRGEVLPIGGLKEKLLAAHRGGITTVLIPHENEKDLAEIPKNIKDKLNIVPVKWIDQVLEHALQHMPVPESKSADKKPAAAKPDADAESKDIVRPH